MQNYEETFFLQNDLNLPSKVSSVKITKRSCMLVLGRFLLEPGYRNLVSSLTEKDRLSELKVCE